MSDTELDLSLSPVKRSQASQGRRAGGPSVNTGWAVRSHHTQDLQDHQDQQDQKRDEEDEDDLPIIPDLEEVEKEDLPKPSLLVTPKAYPQTPTSWPD